MGREGIEAELVSRLTDGVGSDATRRTLVRCLDGELSARATIMQLISAGVSGTALREIVDDVTARTDADSRSGDSLVRDRADELTRLFVENEAACARVAERLAQDSFGDDTPQLSVSDDEASYYERMFDRLVVSAG
jgi:hypothetical protein